nr:u3 small nucleolar rna-associated protein 25 [Quercus suber]
MAPNRGQRGGGRGGRGRGNASRGRGGGRGRGGAGGASKIARSGIRTRGGYKKFDSQRVKEVEEPESGESHSEEIEQDDADFESSDESSNEDLDGKAYSTLLYALHENDGERKSKRRKLQPGEKETSFDRLSSVSGADPDDEVPANSNLLDLEENHVLTAENDVDTLSEAASDDNDEDPSDPFEVQIGQTDGKECSQRLKAFQAKDRRVESQLIGGIGSFSVIVPDLRTNNVGLREPMRSISIWPLKEKLTKTAETSFASLSELQKALAPYITNYVDLLCGNRTPENAPDFRNLACLHALNHVLKGRDRVLKNNARLARAGESADLDIRDQGFTRPKVLILLETRQMAAQYASTIASLFDPEQQENKQRFKDSFTAPLDDRDHMPRDYLELFSGNNDNNFLTGLKFTRKTLKYFAAFYSSDIILASPLGLKRIIEHDDFKKRDHDFLSSIEVCIVDQADAMQMQNWSHVELVFSHLNLQVQDAHGCDFNRVRSFYLDGHANHVRQTLVSSAYITPEMNRLFNHSLQNVAGKVRLTASCNGDIITSTAGLGIKQTFSRFLAQSPAVDPDARFKYFTTAILPSLLRLPKPADNCQGILVYIPSYFDFLRVRNFFATSTLTENISFGAIHDYTETSDQRRARSHFSTGRHSILLYTQRAHHFFRLKIRGVKRVVMYGVPDNGIFYRELVEGYVGTSLNEGKVSPEESGIRVMFSKFEGLKLERIVGSDRVKSMLGVRLRQRIRAVAVVLQSIFSQIDHSNSTKILTLGFCLTGSVANFKARRMTSHVPVDEIEVKLSFQNEDISDLGGIIHLPSTLRSASGCVAVIERRQLEKGDSRERTVGPDSAKLYVDLCLAV